MIEEYTRQLNDKEIKILKQDLNNIKTRLNSFNKALIIIWGIIILIGVPLVITQIKNGLGPLAIIIFLIFLAIPPWVKMEEKKKTNKTIRNINKALEKNQAKGLHCQSQTMYKLKELEDEGDHYIFQVNNNKLLFVGGQEFYENKFFPNTDFEIVTAYGDDIFPVLLEKYCYGEKLKPSKIISGKEKLKKLFENEKFSDIKDIKILDGTLDEIDKILNL